MKYRILLLFLTGLLLTSGCRVTVHFDPDDSAAVVSDEGHEAEAAPDAEAGSQTPEGTDKTADQEPALTEKEDTDTLPEEATDSEAPREENASKEDRAESTADRAHQEIPDYDPTPLPGYEEIVFVGDSRTLTMAIGGTYEFNLVPDDSVEATWGGMLTENSAFENARLAARKHRKKAVFWYGINDVQLNPQRDDPSVFISNYLKVLDAYLSIEPDSTIYIVSILNTTVREKDYYQGQEQNILNYNQALYQLCLERGWYYIDVTGLLTGDDCFQEGDNIHFSKAWYQDRFLPYVTVFTGLNIYQP